MRKCKGCGEHFTRQVSIEDYDSILDTGMCKSCCDEEETALTERGMGYE